LGENIRGFLDSINLEDLTLEARQKQQLLSRKEA
jgi:hypothetical protein